MHRALAYRFLVITMVVASLGVPSAHSQATASLRGTVMDPTGAVIPGAAVIIRSTENGALRRAETNTDGEYSFLQVIPGSYRLIAEKAGFATMSKGNVQLLINTPTSLDLRMSLSSTGEVINVA